MSLSREIHKACKRLPLWHKARQWMREREYLRQRLRLHPQWLWRRGRSCPLSLVEAGRVQIGSRVFVFGGYITLEQVSRRVFVYDLQHNRWQHLGELPPETPETHAGLAHDGRDHILMVAGQVGARCSPATAKCYAFNIRTHAWSEIPPLPEPRYMPVVHYLDGRLYCLSGIREDRRTAATDCWSLGVDGGKATESVWRAEPPLPSPRNHTASLLLDREVLIFGGQQSDVPPRPNDPLYGCDFDSADFAMLDEAFAYELGSGRIRQLARLPFRLGHTDQALIHNGSSVVIAGGTLANNLCSDLILHYDLANDRWQQLGRLPYPMKSKMVACWNDRMYLLAGQRALSEADPRPGMVLDTVWHAAIPKQPSS